MWDRRSYLATFIRRSDWSVPWLQTCDMITSNLIDSHGFHFRQQGGVVYCQKRHNTPFANLTYDARAGDAAAGSKKAARLLPWPKKLRQRHARGAGAWSVEHARAYVWLACLSLFDQGSRSLIGCEAICHVHACPGIKMGTDRRRCNKRLWSPRPTAWWGKN